MGARGPCAPTAVSHPSVIVVGMADTTTPEQLTLLTDSHLPVQFRLDRRTRERGLAHIAAIRRQLAARSAAQPGTARTDHGRAA